MKISSCSDSYLNGFNEIANCRQNGFCITIVAALKILFYFTLVIPAIAYLIGRVTKKSSPSLLDKKADKAGRAVLQEASSIPQDQNIKASKITPQKKLTNEESNKLVNDFVESIKDQPKDEKLYIEIWSKDSKKPQFIRYNGFESNDSRISGTDFRNLKIQLEILSIQSIKLLPKIGLNITPLHRHILKGKGIEFDDVGMIYIPYGKFTYETTCFGNNFYKIHLVANDTQVITTIDVAVSNVDAPNSVLWEMQG